MSYLLRLGFVGFYNDSCAISWKMYFWLCWGYQYLCLFLVTVVRVVKVAISDGSSLRWGRRGLEEGCGGWHCVVQCSWSSVLLLLFCHLISCWTTCWLTPEWRILIVSHDSWYNSMFADCLVIVVSRHNMLPNNQDLSIMIVGIPNVIVRSELSRNISTT